MITALKGNIERLGPSQVYLNVGGIEYEVHVPLTVLIEIQKEKHSPLYLHTYHHFRENEQRLFGFLTVHQREFFRALLNLRGFGPSLGLSLLSHMSQKHFLYICKTQDVSALCRIPRIGKKMAEGLIFEVKHQKKKWDALAPDELQTNIENLPTTSSKELSQEKEMGLALEALVQLGYQEKNAEDALYRIAMTRKKQNEELPTGAAEWIRETLLNL